MVPFSFAGETFVASPEGALYWPARNALLVADLHLEKASWFARLGQMLPPYDSIATLADLTALAASTRWTWIVGNHDPGFADHCGGEIVEEAEVDGLVLRHEADPAESRPEL